MEYIGYKSIKNDSLLINETNGVPKEEEIAILRWTHNFGSICLKIHSYKKHL